jgi:hypothetical protein
VQAACKAAAQVGGVEHLARCVETLAELRDQ